MRQQDLLRGLGDRGSIPMDEDHSFNTIEECCANLFWYDYNGCVGRSPATFKFDFCVDIKGLPDPQDCQSADIFAKVIAAASSQAVQCDWHFSLFGFTATEVKYEKLYDGCN